MVLEDYTIIKKNYKSLDDIYNKISELEKKVNILLKEKEEKKRKEKIKLEKKKELDEIIYSLLFNLNYGYI